MFIFKNSFSVNTTCVEIFTQSISFHVTLTRVEISTWKEITRVISFHVTLTCAEIYTQKEITHVISFHVTLTRVESSTM